MLILPIPATPEEAAPEQQDNGNHLQNEANDLFSTH